MIQFSDSTTEAMYYTTITLLSLALCLLIILTVKAIRTLKKNNRHKSQLFLIGLDIAFLFCVSAELLSLTVGPYWYIRWILNLTNFTGFTFVLLSELEILRCHIIAKTVRLLEVVTNISPRTFRILQVTIMLYSITTGGYHIFYGIFFTTIEDDNTFAKWGKLGIFPWYAGIGLYVIFQSTYIACLLYRHYMQLSAVNKVSIRSQLLLIAISIISLTSIFIVAMAILIITMLVFRKSSNKNVLKVAVYAIANVTVLKAFMASIYPTIFKNIIGLCLTKNSAHEYKRNPKTLS
ncbi:hypothetical protein BC833DRAFT_576204 [Globomyces pollinis-pini]|nr:hypothetical protein BC833DRAFT_576204 [Globomyces pollinis-pini]